LEIGARLGEHVRETAVLVDPARAGARAAARIAHAAMRYRGQPPLDEFLRSNIALAVEQLIEEESEDELARVPLDDSPGAHLLFLWKLLGIEPALVRKASVVFNRQPIDVRQAFAAVVGARMSIHDHAARLGASCEHVRSLLERAIRVMSDAVGAKHLNVRGWDDHG
jgi:hypothetical protein